MRSVDVHATDPDRAGEHRADRRCSCGPKVWRDLSTGRLTVWLHRSPVQTRSLQAFEPDSRSTAVMAGTDTSPGPKTQNTRYGAAR